MAAASLKTEMTPSSHVFPDRVQVNMGKTKIIVSGLDLDLLKKFGKDPCGVCQKGVGSNAISYGGCLVLNTQEMQLHQGPMRPNPDFRCARYLGKARPIDG